MRTLFILLMLVPAAAAAKGEVYKWVDEQGVVHYTDKPPTDEAKPTKLPPLQTYKEGTRPDLRKFDKPTQGGAAGASGLAQIKVVTPSHEETFRGGERTVPVAVMVTPGLKQGQSLLYYLDGAARSEETTDTSFVMTDVERGSHSVSVALVENGREVARSSTITFHMKPPIAKK